MTQTTDQTGRLIVISSTAYQSGFGSAKYKSVCGLTKAEQEIAKNGGIVLFDSGRPSGGGNGLGTTWRRVEYNRGYFNPRVPAETVLATAGVK